jgi:hypothetical protein
LFFVSESEVTSNDLGILTIAGYDLVTSSNIVTGKARIICYIRSGIKYKLLKVETGTDIIALDISDSRVIGLYRGFKLQDRQTRTSFFANIIKTLPELSRTDQKLLIGGDFNVDLFKRSANLNDLQNWAINHGLQQLTDKCTWRRVILDKVHESAIDHVYTNEPNIANQYLNSVSDHDILLVSKPIVQDHRTKLTLRDWRGYTQQRANDPLNIRLAQISSEITLNVLTNSLINVLDELAPKRVIRVKDTQLVSQKLEKLKKREIVNTEPLKRQRIQSI